jgi:hypothetical protein
MTGVMASVSNPLAAHRVPLFVISTYETDYVLVRQVDLDKAVRVLRDSGHEVLREH